jgi:lambda family phage portal protein
VRVPAEDIIHPFIIDRWPQNRGVPWFHAVLKKLRDMSGYTEAEIVAARASANIVGLITTPEDGPGDAIVNEQRTIDVEPGTFKQLLPGEDLKAFIPSRPNAALEPFMRYMLREMAAGIGVSYESLSRDYSQSNYSSSRLSLLDDRDLWRVLQGWLIRGVLMNVYCEWLEAAVLCGELSFPDYSLNREKYRAVRFKPRGWGWIDPTKEVTAFQKAVRSGFMTVSDVVSQTGGGADAEDTFKARRQELDLMDELDLTFDTDPAKVDLPGEVQAVPVDPPEGDPEDGDAETE